MTMSLQKVEVWTQTHTWRTPCEEEGRDWSDATETKNAKDGQHVPRS